MQRIIVTPLIIEGINSVKPSALFAKLLEVVPNTIARARKIYGVIGFIKFI
tara:strand:- start:134 stop:286 length:153 start_codon:yes stop_codon:yes gene_type:complete